jgi:1,4-alpha-glucan branching enzyme
MLQPFLIAILMSKGIPMLWQGEEFAENYFLPEFGAGRVSLLRPLRWDYFYDAAGKPIVALVRKLLRIRGERTHIQTGSYFFFNHWERYQSRGVLLFARYDGEQYTLVGVNTADDEATIPFWFPLPGNYLEELHGDELNLKNVLELQQIALTLPSHYGRIWTRITDR